MSRSRETRICLKMVTRYCAAVLLASACDASWYGPRQSVDLSSLSDSTVADICGRICPAEHIKSISEPSQLATIVRFAQGEATDWRESANGPSGGVINIVFSHDGKVLGTVGLTRADSRSVLLSIGTLSKTVPRDKVDPLLDKIGVALGSP